MLEKKGLYSIKYAGLPDGEHQFDFELNKMFFESYYAQTEILDSNIKAKVKAVRKEHLLSMEIKLKGFVVVECDRCLDSCKIDINAKNNLIFSSSKDSLASKEDESIVEISDTTEYIQMDSYLYDFSILAIPIRRVHDEKDIEATACNKEMLEIIEKLNTKTEDNNAVWDELKKIKSNN